MVKPKLTLYVDVVSPFGYLAYYMCRHSAIFRPVEITYVPIFLGGLMKDCDNRPPIEIRNKGKWIDVERLRYASRFNIPMTQALPAGFPPLTLQTQRALCALELSHPDKVTTALDALYEALWVKGNPAVGKADGFGPVLQKCLGEELTKELLSRMGSPETKKHLSENTNRAFVGGAFGIPWWECTNAEGKKDSFWGFDHIKFACDFLGLDGTLELEGAEKGQRSAGMRVML